MSEEYVSYESFARVYDEFMDNVPYEQWAKFYLKKLKEYGIEKGIVCELGCGTGNMTLRLARAGYDMIGVDNSEEMLLIAGEKAGQESGILYLLQDMREFELYGTVKACVSCCDCVNYILDEEELTQVFSLVNNYLDPGGIFVFDFNTEYKYREIIGDAVIAENRDDCSFIWENYYDEETCVNEYDLTIFARTKQSFFEKYTETHFQRGYTLEQIKSMLAHSGLVFAEALDMDTQGPVSETTERVCVIARESGKQESERE